MAIVLKSNKDSENTTTHAVGAPTYFNIITHKTSNSAHAEAVAGNNILLKMNCETKVEKS